MHGDSFEYFANDVRGLLLLTATSFLQWASLEVWAVQFASPPKASLTSILQMLQKRVLDALKPLAVFWYHDKISFIN